MTDRETLFAIIKANDVLALRQLARPNQWNLYIINAERLMINRLVEAEQEREKACQ